MLRQHTLSRHTCEERLSARLGTRGHKMERLSALIVLKRTCSILTVANAEHMFGLLHIEIPILSTLLHIYDFMGVFYLVEYTQLTIGNLRLSSLRSQSVDPLHRVLTVAKVVL
jgi:hypothetical protein